jgi:PAS domain S-box-containing protein
MVFMVVWCDRDRESAEGPGRADAICHLRSKRATVRGPGENDEAVPLVSERYAGVAMVETLVDDLRGHLNALSDAPGVLASLIEYSPTPLALYNPAGFCVRVNPAYRELFGDEPRHDRELAEDEVLGRSGVLFWVRRAFGGEVITTPSFWYEHAELPRPEARTRIALSARAFPLRDSRGDIEFVAIGFRDETDSLLLAERRRVDAEEPSRLIDEIQRADLERRTNEEQFRAVFEQCADGVMITDDLGRVLEINPSGCRIFGAREQSIVGSRYWDHIGDVAESRPNSEKLMEHGQLSTEVQVWRADGQLRDLELRAVANFLPHRHLTTFLDVTERNDALHALQRSEAHLIASQRIAHVGSWEYELIGSSDDLDSNILRCSDECYRLFGLEPGSVEVTAKGSISFVHPDDRAQLVKALRQALATGTVYSNEHRIVRADGTEIVVYARGEIEFDPETGKPLRLVGTTQDVTERSRVREQIQRLNEELEGRVAERTSQLEAANRDLEAFAYSVSHDLRAPLRAINGYSEILREESGNALTEMGRTSLERIAFSVRRMDGLIDGLLALSRLGRRATEIREISPRPIVEEALEEVGLRGETSRAEVIVGNLPKCRADAALLRQVFVNLVGNAAKFSRDRDPAVIEIGCRRTDGENVWFVRDNGIGFDMRHAPKVFDVFQRLTSAEAYEGTGVGLAIVDRIIRRHGGRIWAESAPNRGATFYFTL